MSPCPIGTAGACPEEGRIPSLTPVWGMGTGKEMAPAACLQPQLSGVRHQSHGKPAAFHEAAVS